MSCWFDFFFAPLCSDRSRDLFSHTSPMMKKRGTPSQAYFERHKMTHFIVYYFWKPGPVKHFPKPACGLSSPRMACLDFGIRYDVLEALNSEFRLGSRKKWASHVTFWKTWLHIRHSHGLGASCRHALVDALAAVTACHCPGWQRTSATFHKTG